MTHHISLYLGLFLAISLMVLSPVAVRAEITGIKVEVSEKETELLTFTSKKPIAITKTFVLENPERLVIDIPQTKASGLKLPKDYNGKLLKSIRFGLFDKKTARIVFDLNAPAKIVALSSGSSFTVEIAPLNPVAAPVKHEAESEPEPKQEEVKTEEPKEEPKKEEVKKEQPKLTKAQLAKEQQAKEKAIKDKEAREAKEKEQKAAKEKEEEEEAEEAKPVEKKPPAAPAKPAKPPKPLVMIDAGHGGQDPGAIGLHGTQEKSITLNYAKALRDALIKTGRYRAQLTRSDDRFIKLGDRVEIARKAKADIFISLHADAHPKKTAHGLSVYTLSETASDEEAAALAERENKSDVIHGLDLNTTDADVASILIDLAQRETMNKSARLADAIVKSMSRKVTRRADAHRFAGFRVLKAPDIPSVLIELGYVTSAKDERALLTPKYRDAVISSIVKGVDRFSTQ